MVKMKRFNVFVPCIGFDVFQIEAKDELSAIEEIANGDYAPLVCNVDGKTDTDINNWEAEEIKE